MTMAPPNDGFDALQSDFRAIVGDLQTMLQPGGSPPHGGPVVFSRWIIDETIKRIETLQVALEQIAKFPEDESRGISEHWGWRMVKLAKDALERAENIRKGIKPSAAPVSKP